MSFFFGPKALLMNLLNLLSQVFQRHNAMVPYVEGLTEEEANSIGDSLRDLIQTRIHGLQRPRDRRQPTIKLSEEQKGVVEANSAMQLRHHFLDIYYVFHSLADMFNTYLSV